MMDGETVMSGAPVGEHVSSFKVMRSGAGWYIGTTTTEEGFEEPYTRETDYFRTEADAVYALGVWKSKGILHKQRR